MERKQEQGCSPPTGCLVEDGESSEHVNVGGEAVVVESCDPASESIQMEREGEHANLLAEWSNVVESNADMQTTPSSPQVMPGEQHTSVMEPQTALEVRDNFPQPIVYVPLNLFLELVANSSQLPTYYTVTIVNAHFPPDNPPATLAASNVPPQNPPPPLQSTVALEDPHSNTYINNSAALNQIMATLQQAEITTTTCAHPVSIPTALPARSNFSTLISHEQQSQSSWLNTPQNLEHAAAAATFPQPPSESNFPEYEEFSSGDTCEFPFPTTFCHSNFVSLGESMSTSTATTGTNFGHDDDVIASGSGGIFPNVSAESEMELSCSTVSSSFYEPKNDSN